MLSDDDPLEDPFSLESFGMSICPGSSFLHLCPEGHHCFRANQTGDLSQRLDLSSRNRTTDFKLRLDGRMQQRRFDSSELFAGDAYIHWILCSCFDGRYVFVSFFSLFSYAHL